MFAVKRYVRGSTRRASSPQTSSWTSAHAQGYFSATILEHLAFEGFTLSDCFRGTAAKSRALRFELARLSD
jgi:hypothetical protein